MIFDLDLCPFDHMNIWRFPYYINKPSLVQIGLQFFKWGHFYIFSLSFDLTSDDLWPCYMTFDCMNVRRFPYFINAPSLVPIWLHLFKWDHFHLFSLSYNLTLDDLDLGIWPLTVWTYEGSHIISINQVWFQSHRNFSNEATFTFSAYLTTWPQMTFDLDMWPLTSSTNEGSHVASMTQLLLKSIKTCRR